MWLGAMFAGGCLVLAVPSVAQQHVEVDMRIVGAKDGDPQLRVGDRVVVCFTVSLEGWVSLWSDDAEGKEEKIYPNSHSRTESRTGVAVAAGEENCVGEQGDTFRLRVMRPLGASAIRAVWTRNAEDQGKLEDTVAVGGSKSLGPGNSLGRTHATNVLDYTVVE